MEPGKSKKTAFGIDPLHEWSCGHRAPAMCGECYRQLAAKAIDDPEADGTDFAHAAWWRGHEQTALLFCREVNDILDGKDDGTGFNYEPWHSLRRRLLALADRNVVAGNGDDNRHG